MRRKVVRFTVTVLTYALSLAAGLSQTRDLTFEDRVKAQEKIERVYYAHQIGATRPFEEAVPRAVLEKKVRTYLKQSVALEEFWNTPLTGEALEKELSRIAQKTRFPDRLTEVYAALEDDPFLVEECFVRPALADRLTHGFFSFDQRIHGDDKRKADALQQLLAGGGRSVESQDVHRTVFEVSNSDIFSRSHSPIDQMGAHERTFDGVGHVDLGAADYSRWRAGAPARVGGIGPVQEEPDAFVVKELVGETTDRFQMAVYVVRKRTWDEWWEEASSSLDELQAPSVASAAAHLPLPPALSGPRVDGTQSFDPESAAASPSCVIDDTWQGGVLDGAPPERRTQHTAVWTGTHMIVWGGYDDAFLNTGGSYDPVTDYWTATSLTNAPDPRSHHTAIWTGSSMVVWGGYNELGYLNSGGRYDPATNSWSPTSTAGGPSARYLHTAVWTGNRMLVWGGYNATGFLNTGGRYDPVADTWTSTSAGAAPSPRYLHTSVWTGSRMIVWGGYGSSGPLSTGSRYDPVGDSWTATSAPPMGARYRHSAVWTGAVMVVWGGQSASGYLQTGGRYDPAADTWSPTSLTGVPAARSRHSAVWDGSRMVIWGGSSNQSPYYFSDGGGYDPQNDSWVSYSTGPSARYDHTAIWTGSRMIVWGGRDNSEVPQDTGGRIDLSTSTSTPTSTNPQAARSLHTAVWTGNVMIVWGGNSGGSNSLNTGARYDPLLDNWVAISAANVPTGRVYHTANWTGSTMLVWGGFNETPPNQAQPLNSGGSYDPIANAWTHTSLTNAPVPRYLHTAVWTGSRLIAWGGINLSATLDTGGLYDPIADTWTQTPATNAPSPRFDHAAVWTGTEMLVWGGQESGGVFPGTGARYDPSANSWSPISTVNAPPGRQLLTAAWTGSQMLIWGGTNVSFESSGGRYTPSTDSWAPTSLFNAPSGRYFHTSVWTGTWMVVWGGLGGTVPLSTGGRYNPATNAWTTTSMTNVPSARYGHTAVWTGSMMVVWGGYGAGSGPLNTGGRYLVDESADSDHDGFTVCAGDCNDADPSVHPGVSDANCDGIDNDCSGIADDAYVPQQTLCGIGACSRSGSALCVNGAVLDNCLPGQPTTEICDGLDNDCDGITDDVARPAGIPSLTVQKVANGAARLSRSNVVGATGYDFIRGSLIDLRLTGGNFSVATNTCLGNDRAATTLDDGDRPPPDAALWYLIRAVNCGGTGTYDSGFPSQVRSRDAGVQASGAACP